MQNDDIEIIGACENNLKNVDITIPKGKLVVFVGVSGSGKSSLVFDTIAVESNRQWNASYPLYIRNKMPNYERPKVNSIKNLTPSIIINQKSISSNSRSTVATATDVAPLIRLLFSRVGKPSAGGSMAYSFNHPMGMCQHCTGLGKEMVLNETLLFDTSKTLKEGAINFSQFSNGWQKHIYQSNPKLDPDKKLQDYSQEEWEILKYGSNCNMKVEIVSNNTGRVDKVDYEGVIPRFNRLYLKRDITKLRKKLQEEIMSLVHNTKCTQCNGTGLNSKALQSKINGYNIMDYMDLSIYELLPLLKDITSPVGKSIAMQIIDILERMVEVGIGYLSLSRKTDTLSGGELQRIKIVRNLGNSLTNLTYIFDEPTSGLHHYDAEKIGKLLIKLKNNHNNILVVEHSKQMMKLSDYIIELGPKAGSEGGKIQYYGTLEDLKNKKTPTSKIFNQTIKLNKKPKKWTESYQLENLNSHNLKNIDVKIPKGVLTAITGVAGSGKSSLCEEFMKKYPDTILVNQKQIGTSIRSNSATYLGIMDNIRKKFAKENNVTPSYFSFNSKGACPACKGKGYITYDMAFADSVEVLCEECQGHRYNTEVLNYTFNNKNIMEVLDLTVDEALKFFDDKKIQQALQSLHDVGLGYLKLGQSTNTMSGGEIQRLKLADKLHEKGKTYILDEPSSGLHNEDLQKLLELLKKIVDNNNTVIIVEHRLEMISQADWIIDLGPLGGTEGGEIIFEGEPEKIVEDKLSKTGYYLKQQLIKS